MNKYIKYKKTYVLIMFLLVLVVITLLWIKDLEEKGLIVDVNKNLAEFQHGDSINKYKDRKDLDKFYIGPLSINEIKQHGYKIPNRDLRDGEQLIILNDGETLTYLYFNIDGYLIFKEANGS